MNKAVFLDRDGTVIEERHYLHKPEEVALIQGAGPALAKLEKAGYRLIFVTNQSGVGRGYFTLKDVENVNRHLNGLLAEYGVNIVKTYVAPEAPDQPSRGRKPSPQFLLDARDEFHLDLAQCYMVGDKWIDVECGLNAGVKASIMVRTGHGAEEEAESAEKLKTTLVVDDVSHAAEWILRQT